MLGMAICIPVSFPRCAKIPHPDGAMRQDLWCSAGAAGLSLRRRVALDVEPLDIGLGGGLGGAARSQERDPRPILARPVIVAGEPADIAALEERRHRIGSLGQRLLDV